MIKPDTNLYSVKLDPREQKFEIVTLGAHHLSLNHGNRMVNRRLIESVSEVTIGSLTYDYVLSLPNNPDTIAVNVPKLTKEYYVFTMYMASGDTVHWKFKTYAEANSIFGTLKYSKFY